MSHWQKSEVLSSVAEQLLVHGFVLYHTLDQIAHYSQAQKTLVLSFYISTETLHRSIRLVVFLCLEISLGVLHFVDSNAFPDAQQYDEDAPDDSSQTKMTQK